MKTYDINSTAMCGEAYVSAITNVACMLNKTMGTNFFYARDWAQLDMLAEKLGIRFDENGNIVR